MFDEMLIYFIAYAFGWAYAVGYMHVAVHEFAHALAALVFSVRVFDVRIGAKLFSVKLGPIYISPIVFGGETNLSQGEYEETTWWGKCLINLAGPMANAVVGVIGYFMLPVVANDVCLVCGMGLALLNLVPFFKESDGAGIFNDLRKEFWQNR